MKRIPVAEPNLTGLERRYLMEAYDSGWISSKGSFISRFEVSFSDYLDSKYSLTTTNGTVSLYLILMSMGIKRGDEVIVPSLTYIASVNAIRFVGAEPVFVDVDPETWNMDPSKIEQVITDRTRVIMGVHLYGNPFDLEAILRICKENDLLLIEDAAEALGSEFQGKMVGSFGNAGSFSFFGNKTVTTGEGGMVVTDDQNLHERMQVLKNQGNSRSKRYWHDMIGYNFRMTNLQAAVGLGQMDRIDELVLRKRNNAEQYGKLLDRDIFTVQKEKSDTRNSYWMYTILVNSLENDEQRNNLIDRLDREHGIETRPLFYPAHMMDMYRKTPKGDLNITEDIYYKGISLPSSTLLTEDQIIYISDVLNSIKVVE